MFVSTEGRVEARDGTRTRVREWQSEYARHRAQINAAEAREVELAAEMIENEYWHHYQGIGTPVAFLSWKMGLTPGTARHVVKAARAKDRLPKVFAAFKAGELNRQQVVILDEICEPETEELLLEAARGLSGSQLSRFAGHYRNALSVERNDAARKRYLRFRYPEDGTGRISGSLPAEQCALVESALKMAMKAMHDQGDGPDRDADDQWGAHRADALQVMAESFMSNGLKEMNGTDAYQVVVNVDIGGSSEDDQDLVGKVAGHGSLVSKETVERLRCDASFVEMISKGKDQLYVGRKRREPTTPLRRALQRRDQCCPFPGCNRTGRLQAHHIDWWTRDQGTTDIDKLVLLCPMHHRLLHQGCFIIERGADGTPVFRDPSGDVIKHEPLEALAEDISELDWDSDVDAETCTPDWGGERGSLRDAASVYMSAREHRRQLANAPP